METEIIPNPPRPDPVTILRAVSQVLRPLIRALIKSGVTFPVLSDLLRSLFVEVAAAELWADGRSRTDSRISLLTGIHRKELRRQRTQGTALSEPDVVTLHNRVIARWLADAAYLGPDGVPATLPRSGAAPSFDALVATVTKDVHPRTVLDDLLSQGIVKADQGETVSLLARAHVPEPSGEAHLFYFARNLHDHAAAAVANVFAERPPFLDRSVHYDGLSPAAALKLEELARAAAEQTLLDVNRAALALADADVPAATTRRVNLGIYVFAEDEPGAA